MNPLPDVGIVLFLLSVPQTEQSPQALHDEVARLSEQVQSARKAKDHPTWLALGRRLAELTPNNPRSLLNLARAQALNRQVADAMLTLSRFAAMGMSTELQADPDLADLRTDAAFPRLAATVSQNLSPVVHGSVAFTLPEKDLLTESVVFDPKTNAFLVSSIHRRKILRIAADGSAKDWVPEGRDGLLAVLALAVDGNRRALWATCNALPQMAGYRKEDEGASYLAEFDLDTGVLRRKVEPASRAFLGDITVGPDGAVYISAPDTGRIYLLRPGARTLEVFLAEGIFFSPQGLTWSADEQDLFVADYALGIARVNPRTSALVWLKAPGDVSLYGIDGLVEAGSWLVGIQNGMPPHRIVGLRLDAKRERIVEARVLDSAHPHFEEPTLAVRVGGDLFAIARSQWEKFREDGSVDSEHLQAPLILKTPLPWLSP